MRHIYLKCKNHPDLKWHCKSIAVEKDGSYNGARNLFFAGDVKKECKCSLSTLTFADEGERKKWEQDRKNIT